jgi:hypothetical protein
MKEIRLMRQQTQTSTSVELTVDSGTKRHQSDKRFWFYGCMVSPAFVLILRSVDQGYRYDPQYLPTEALTDTANAGGTEGATE